MNAGNRHRAALSCNKSVDTYLLSAAVACPLPAAYVQL